MLGQYISQDLQPGILLNTTDSVNQSNAILPTQIQVTPAAVNGPIQVSSAEGRTLSNVAGKCVDLLTGSLP